MRSVGGLLVRHREARTGGLPSPRPRLRAGATAMLKTIALRASIVTTAASRKSHPARQAISRCVVSSREMKYYAVKRGRQTGIFENWAIVEPLVRGFSGAEHKSFASLRDAEDYLGVPAAAAPAPSAGPSGSGAAAAAAGSQQASASGASHEAADVGGHQAAAAPQQPPPQQTAYGADGGTPPAPPLVPVNPALLYRIEFDGAARGNPGPAGCGAFIVEHGGAGREVKRCRRSLGVATNNEAEYQVGGCA